MSRSDIETLEGLLRRHQRSENRQSEELAAAKTALRLAQEKEWTARQESQRRQEAIARCDSDAHQEFMQGVSVGSIDGRAAYRVRLVGEHEMAVEAVERALAVVEERDENRRQKQAELAKVAAKRTAAEKMLSKARRDVMREADERADEEIADLRASRRDREE